jgi:hypothetical protein
MDERRPHVKPRGVPGLFRRRSFWLLLGLGVGVALLLVLFHGAAEERSSLGGADGDESLALATPRRRPSSAPAPTVEAASASRPTLDEVRNGPPVVDNQQGGIIGVVTYLDAPVAGAVVSLLVDSGRSTETRPDGTFRIEVEPGVRREYAWATLTVTAEDGALGHELNVDLTAGVGPSLVDLGRIQLLRRTPCSLRIHGADSQPAASASVAIISYEPTFRELGCFIASESGRVSATLGPGRYFVAAQKDDLVAHAVFAIEKIGDSRAVDVFLARARMHRISVVDAATGAPVSAARVKVTVEAPRSQGGAHRLVIPTFGEATRADDAGIAECRLPEKKDYVYLISAEAPDYRTPSHAIAALSEEGTTTVRLEGALRFAWSVHHVECRRASPIGDVKLLFPDAVPRHIGLADTSREAGVFSVVTNLSAFELGHALAVASDGCVGWVELAPESASGRASLAVYEPREVTVALRDEGGAPVANWMIEAVVTSELRSTRFASLTDSAGTARLGPLPPCDLAIGGRSARAKTRKLRPLGTASVVRSTAVTIEAVIPVAFHADISIFEQGRRSMPVDLGVRLQNANQDALQIDSSAAFVQVTMRPIDATRPVVVELTSAQYAPTLIAIDPAHFDRNYRGRVELVPTSEMVVTLGAGVAASDHDFVLDRWDPVGRAWTSSAPGESMRIAAGAISVTGLQPGDYRVRDAATGASSEVAHVTTDAQRVTATIDLPRMVEISGRIAGWDGRQHRLRVKWALENASIKKFVAVDGDGAFSFKAPAEVEVVLDVESRSFAAPSGTMPPLATMRARGPVTNLSLAVPVR